MKAGGGTEGDGAKAWVALTKWDTDKSRAMVQERRVKLMRPRKCQAEEAIPAAFPRCPCEAGSEPREAADALSCFWVGGRDDEPA